MRRDTTKSGRRQPKNFRKSSPLTYPSCWTGSLPLPVPNASVPNASSLVGSLWHRLHVSGGNACLFTCISPVTNAVVESGLSAAKRLCHLLPSPAGLPACRSQPPWPETTILFIRLDLISSPWSVQGPDWRLSSLRVNPLHALKYLSALLMKACCCCCCCCCCIVLVVLSSSCLALLAPPSFFCTTSLQRAHSSVRVHVLRLLLLLLLLLLHCACSSVKQLPCFACAAKLFLHNISATGSQLCPCACAAAAAAAAASSACL